MVMDAQNDRLFPDNMSGVLLLHYRTRAMHGQQSTCVARSVLLALTSTGSYYSPHDMLSITFYVFIAYTLTKYHSV
jgi:hypothetical protein